MIATEKLVETAVDYLNMNPHPLAAARKRVTDAEIKARRSFADAFLAAEGSVDARKAHAELSEDYTKARTEESNALYELERERARVKGAEMIIEIWRTENANARAVERVR